jgi:hypothetical protein
VTVALALAMLSGRVLDRTTGQGLAHVRVTAGSSHATTDRSGGFTLRGLKSGPLGVTLESDDVPVQHFTVTVRGATEHDFRACSTTLDYNCGAPALPNAPGGGAS